jgi:hypothetical protein
VIRVDRLDETVEGEARTAGTLAPPAHFRDCSKSTAVFSGWNAAVRAGGRLRKSDGIGGDASRASRGSRADGGDCLVLFWRKRLMDEWCVGVRWGGLLGAGEPYTYSHKLLTRKK